MPESGDTVRGRSPDADPAASRSSKFSHLAMRTASTLVLAPAALAAAWLGGWLFALPIALFALYGMYEWNRMTGSRALPLLFAEAVVLFVALGFLIEASGLLGLSVLALGAAGVVGLGTFLNRPGMWPAAGLIYLGIAVLCLVWIRETQGYVVTFWLLFLVWASDIAAYITGSLLGGPKLAPRLSPGKTWAGLVGGCFAAAGVSAGFGAFTGIGGHLDLAVLGGLLGCWSQLGDIVESTIKRRFNVKDSGRLIPGHGGVLDRIDSLVFTVPLVAGLLVASGRAGVSLFG